MDNPLLAMLKQASTAMPPSAPPSAAAPAPAQREQAMSPGMKPVSLDDLFKSMTPQGSRNVSSTMQGGPTSMAAPPPVNTASGTNGPSYSSPGGVGHQAKLLGMLSLGKPTSSSSPISADSRPNSGIASASSRDEDRRTSLLNVLKSPTAAPAPLGEPVITHPVPPPQQAVPTPPVASTPNSAAASPLPPPMPKSMFDFVSPFDAFERPTSRAQPPTGSGAATAPRSSASPVKPSNNLTPVGALSPAVGSPSLSSPAVGTPGLVSPALASPMPAQTPSGPSTPADLTHVRSHSPAIKQVQNVRTGSRRPSAASSPPGAKGKTDLGLPWLVTKVAKNVEGTGPKRLPSGPITIDFSRANTDALINTPGTVEVTPTTIMRAENVGFQRGRTVAATKGWLAYTLSRGRIRLIDRISGARTIIQLDATGPITDVAAAAETLAVVASDGSVSVFSIPSNWDRDDPPCPLIFSLQRMSPDLVPADKSLGDINHIEFVRRAGSDTPSLAIGGTDGVVIVNPYDWRGNPEADAREVLTSSKVMKTTGVLAAFCLNSTNQAIGLLSTTGYFSLYSVVNLNRVWNRQLPSPSSQVPSSVCFCESNILVGRANDTHFDLVQITIEIAVLATIKFTAPSPSPSALHFSHAAYNAEREVLVIAPFARGSAYAFHYALKGQAPQRGVMNDHSHVKAFDSVAEYPLDGPVLSFVLGPSDDDLELFYSTPNGINQASIEKSSLQSMSKAAPPPVQEAKPVQPARNVEAKKAPTKTESAAQGYSVAAASAPTAVRSPTVRREIEVPVNQVPSSVVERTAERSAPTGGLSSDDLAKALRKSEDKMSAALRQIVSTEIKTVTSRLDKDKDLATTVSTAVANHLKAHLPTIVQQELKRIPIQAEVRQAVAEQAPSAIHQSVQGLSAQLERAIAPIVPRTIATVVQPTVQRAVHDAIETVLVPAVMEATNGMYNQLADDLKTEMLQIRKDVNDDQGDALNATNAMVRNMANSIAELQKQVAALSAQLSRNQHRAVTPVPAPAPAIITPPTLPAPVTGPSSLPPSQQLEDTFMNSLQQGTTAAALQLVNEFASRVDAILPMPPTKSPLSQAVLLSLVHRLPTALAELPPHMPMFQTAATWLRRAAELIDPRDQTIASYYPRALPGIEAGISGIIDRLQSQGPDPLIQAHMNVLRQTLDVIKAKAMH